MDRFNKESSIFSMKYDLFDTMVHRCHRSKKNRSVEKHIARRISRKKLKDDIKLELKEIEKQKNIDVSGF